MTKFLLAAAASAATVLMFSTATSAHGAIAYALTDENSLLSFDTAAPTALLGGIALRSPSNGSIEDLIGIDIRPATNELYGVGKFGTIYTINPATGVATQTSTLSTMLSGSRFGVDFNPAADRLRIVSNTDQNLRVDVTSGGAIIDGTLNPGNPNVTAVAYSNNDNDAGTSTTLYAIDTVTDQLLIQSPPNNGTLISQGSLGIDISSIGGFDIQTVGGNNTAFAALQMSTSGVSQLYTINLATGSATLLGTIGGGDIIDGLAVTVPEPTMMALAAGALCTLRRRRVR